MAHRSLLHSFSFSMYEYFYRFAVVDSRNMHVCIYICVHVTLPTVFFFFLFINSYICVVYILRSLVSCCFFQCNRIRKLPHPANEQHDKLSAIFLTVVVPSYVGVCWCMLVYVGVCYEFLGEKERANGVRE